MEKPRLQWIRVEPALIPETGPGYRFIGFPAKVTYECSFLLSQEELEGDKPFDRIFNAIDRTPELEKLFSEIVIPEPEIQTPDPLLRAAYSLLADPRIKFHEEPNVKK